MGTLAVKQVPLGLIKRQIKRYSLVEHPWIYSSSSTQFFGGCGRGSFMATYLRYEKNRLKKVSKEQRRVVNELD